MNRVYSLILIGLLLSSCSNNKSNTQKLVSNLNNELRANYKIEQGNLMAAYDLAKINKDKCIFASDYVLIVNDENYNKLFLKKFRNRFKHLDNLKKQALIKIGKIKSLVLKVNNKYKFLTATELQVLKRPPHSKNTSIAELSHLDKIIDSIPYLLPSYKPIVTSHYGMRRHPFKKKMKFHCGIDLVDRKSTPVYSAANGIVTKIEKNKTYGNTITIKHSHNFKTKYAHLKKIDIIEGQNILRGQQIGVQGSTGRSTGEHLHFEIWLNGKHIDPFDFLAHGCNC